MKDKPLVKLILAIGLIVAIVTAFSVSLIINANQVPPIALDNTKFSSAEIEFQRLIPQLLNCETTIVAEMTPIRERVWEKLDSIEVFLVESIARESYKLDYMEFQSRFINLRVRANLGIPSTPRPENGYPAVVFLHGLKSNPDLVFTEGKVDYNNAIGKRLVQRGYVVIAPYTFNGLTWRSKAEVFYNIREIDAANAVTSVDLLLELGIVNENKIIVYGISQGGSNARLTAAIDDRIDLLVLSGNHNAPYEYIQERGILAEGIHPQSFEGYPACSTRVMSEFLRIEPRPILFEYSNADSQAFGVQKVVDTLKEYNPDWLLDLEFHKSGHAIDPTDATLKRLDRIVNDSLAP